MVLLLIFPINREVVLLLLAKIAFAPWIITAPQQSANIRYKNAGDPIEYCAMAQLVDPNTELPAFFPSHGYQLRSPPYTSCSS